MTTHLIGPLGKKIFINHLGNQTILLATIQSQIEVHAGVWPVHALKVINIIKIILKINWKPLQGHLVQLN